MWIIFLIVAIIILSSIMLWNFIFGKRCEGNPNLKYFTADDFEELEAKKIEFKSNKGQILRGNIYTNKNIKEYKGLVIFVHGMGAGHLSYTTEINTIAKSGYKVLSYDNTGCCASDGKSMNGFYQAVLDLKYCLEFVKENKELNKYKVNLIGHSWGAYSVCQVLKYGVDVKTVTAMSGPENLEELLTGSMGVIGKILKPFIRCINFIKFGNDGIQSTKEVLKKVNENTNILLFHGKADKTCPEKRSIVFESEIAFEGKTNIVSVMFEEKCHNIYQTLESEKYLNEVFGNIAGLKKKYKGKELEEKTKELYGNIDYKKITEEDPDVMKSIIDFLNENNK